MNSTSCQGKHTEMLSGRTLVTALAVAVAVAAVAAAAPHSPAATAAAAVAAVVSAVKDVAFPTAPRQLDPMQESLDLDITTTWPLPVLKCQKANEPQVSKLL